MFELLNLYAEDVYLERKVGPYMPHVHEKILQLVTAQTVSDKEALCLKATNTFVDVYGRQRNKGDEYLITSDMSSHHIFFIIFFIFVYLICFICYYLFDGEVFLSFIIIYFGRQRKFAGHFRFGSSTQESICCHNQSIR